MLASAIGVDAVREADVGAVVGGDDRAGGVVIELGARGGAVGVEARGVLLVVQRDEAVRRVVSGAATARQVRHDGSFTVDYRTVVPGCHESPRFARLENANSYNAAMPALP